MCPWHSNRTVLNHLPVNLVFVYLLEILYCSPLISARLFSGPSVCSVCLFQLVSNFAIHAVIRTAVQNANFCIALSSLSSWGDIADTSRTILASDSLSSVGFVEIFSGQLLGSCNHPPKLRQLPN